MDKIKKPIGIASAILLIFSFLFGIWYFYAIGQGGEYLDTATNLFLRYFYLLFIIAIACVVVFSVVNIFSSAKAAKKSLFMLAGFGLLVLIAYIFSTNEIPQFMGSEKFFGYPDVKTEVYNQSLAQGMSVNDAEAKALQAVTDKGKVYAGTVDTGLKMLYIVMLCAVLSIVVTEIQSTIIKNI